MSSFIDNTTIFEDPFRREMLSHKAMNVFYERRNQLGYEYCNKSVGLTFRPPHSPQITEKRTESVRRYFVSLLHEKNHARF